MNERELRLQGEELQREMKEFCHAPECSRPEQCPREHIECGELLDTVSAMMWIAAGEVVMFGCNSKDCDTCTQIVARPRIYMSALDYHAPYDERISRARKLMIKLQEFNTQQLEYKKWRKDNDKAKAEVEIPEEIELQRDAELVR